MITFIPALAPHWVPATGQPAPLLKTTSASRVAGPWLASVVWSGVAGTYMTVIVSPVNVPPPASAAVARTYGMTGAKY
jgi:hypothetical protein